MQAQKSGIQAFSSWSLSRRRALQSLGGMLAAACLPNVSQAEMPTRSKLGLVIYCAAIRRQHLRQSDPAFDLYRPLSFLRHCVSLGAGGMQCALGTLTVAEIHPLRNELESTGSYLEAIVKLPRDDADVARFDAEMKTAQACGAVAVRTTIIPGRRYEQFQSLADYRQAAEQGKKLLERGAPIAEKYRLPIAVENHKDQRNAERLELFAHIDSEFVGACVDTGNSIALLEDPLQTIRDFAPWAKSVHLKDQALLEYDAGFLLGDVPLGQGSLDLKSMVQILRSANPQVQFSLELITRDPLLVPCMTEQYWATFPDLPARDLANVLRYVRAHPSQNGQDVSQLSQPEQLAREDQNVRESLDYARTELGLTR